MTLFVPHIRDFTRVLPFLALGFLVALLMPALPASAATAPAFMEVNGQPGDYLTNGESFSFSSSAGDDITWDAGPTGLQVWIFSADGSFSGVHLAAPDGGRLEAGRYVRAVRWPTQEAGSPSMGIDLFGGACSTVAGNFKVKEAVYSIEGALERFDATFEQHCEGIQPAMFGRIRLGIEKPLAPVEEVPPNPAHLQMAGDPGDWVTDGQSYSYNADQGDLIDWYLYEEAVNVFVNGAAGDWWSVTLKAPGAKRLRDGRTYAGAVRYPTQDGTTPGLNVDGNGRGCGSLTGSFTVHDVRYGSDANFSNTLLYLHASFEQHCDGAKPALRGEIAFGKPRPGGSTPGV
jgi:hypothetical protein